VGLARVAVPYQNQATQQSSTGQNYSRVIGRPRSIPHRRPRGRRLNRLRTAMTKRERSSAHQVVGVDRRRRDRSPCGLCGNVGPLTKTHVPAQSAGNKGLVTRRVFVTDSQDGESTMKDGPPKIGGIHFYGLCADCNQLQNQYDSAYVELVDISLPWLNTPLILPTGPREPPRLTLRPGAAARSVLIPMFGLNTELRNTIPHVAEALLARDPVVSVRPGWKLRLAIAGGVRARVSGSVGGFEMFGRRLDGRPLGVLTMAQVHFPPLAWQLVPSDQSILDLEGWADVSRWLERPPDEEARFRDVSSALPVVELPRHGKRGDLWTELFSDEITFIVESEDVSPGFRERSA
jgi:hypothetical protein